MEEDLGHFDVLLTNTSFSTSKMAGALALQGKKVLVLDESSRYGGPHNCSLDLLSFLELRKPSTVLMEPGFKAELMSPAFNRKFIIDMQPVVLSASGPICKGLIEAHLGEYLEFRPISKLGVFTSTGDLVMVPASKEDIFVDPTLSLVEKRQISKIINSEKNFKDPIEKMTPKLRETILYGVLLSKMNEDLTEEAALQRIQAYREGLGRFGPSPYLYPIYGSSELAQAYCRQAAVHGATFIMGQKFHLDNGKVSGCFEGREWSATFDTMIGESLPPKIVKRAVLVIDEPFQGESGTCLWTILSNSAGGVGSVTLILCTGSDSSCAPKYFSLLHVWSDQDDIQSALAPHLSFPGEPDSRGLPNALLACFFEGPEPILGPHNESCS